MAKELHFTIRVDEALRSDFIEAARHDDMDGSKVVRDFMRNYVAQSRGRQRQAANDSIQGMDRLSRQDAVDFALASVALEGFTPSAAAQARAREFVAGVLSVADLGPSRG